MNFNRKQLLSVFSAVLLFLFTVILLGLLYRYDNKYTQGPPYGKEGVFSFTEKDLDRPLFLIDGWRLKTENPDELTVFIGQYSNYSYVPGMDSPFGTAVYRLTLRYTGTPCTLLLEIPEIYTDFTLTVNGTTQENIENCRMIPINAGEGHTTLEFTITNKSHYYSGLTYPPALGTPDTMNQLFFIRTFFYSVLCIFSFTLAAFSLVLWLSKTRDSLFFHFGILCIAFAVQCAHPFIWQFGLSGKVWYAVEDTARLLILAQVLSLSFIAAGLQHAATYKKFLRPLSLAACLLCLLFVLFIIPRAGNLVNLYGQLLDFYKMLIWALLACTAGAGLMKDPGASNIFTLYACSIFGASLAAGIRDSNQFEPVYTGWQNEYTGFLLVLVFAAQMILRNKRLLEQEKEMQVLELQTRFAAESVVQMKDSIRKVRAARHEISHHVNVLSAFYHSGEYERLGSYLSGLKSENDVLPLLYYSENFLVNAILTNYLEDAKKKGILTEYTARVPNVLPFDDTDLSVLLSNILANALERLQALPADNLRFLRFHVKVKGSFFTVSCENSCLPGKGKRDKFPTTKTPASSHGLGIPAMKKTVEKYGGTIEICQENRVFTVKAVLPLPCQDK